MLAESSSELVVESHHLVVVQSHLFFIDIVGIYLVVTFLSGAKTCSHQRCLDLGSELRIDIEIDTQI